MARSIKKGPFVDEHLLKKIAATSDSRQKQVIRTWSRRSTIIPDMVGHTIGVGSSRVDLQACKLEYSIVSPK